MMQCLRIPFIVLVFLSIFLLLYVFLSTDRILEGAGLKRNYKTFSSRMTLQHIVAHAANFQTHSCEKISVNVPNIMNNATPNGWKNPVSEPVFIFSAFFDNRYGLTNQQVRLIGMIEGDFKKPLYCQLWYENISLPLVVESEMREIWLEIWSKADRFEFYRPYMINCPVPQDNSVLSSNIPQGVYNSVLSNNIPQGVYNSVLSNNIPQGVSLSLHPCSNSTVFFKLAVPPRNATKHKFAICVKSLDFQNDISFRLIEWLELQFLLGVDEITIYVFNVHSNTYKVLLYYEQLGKITIIPIALPGSLPNTPLERTKFLHENLWQKRRHELIPYNDCFYRHIYTHEFVILLDVDEAIIPVNHKTWTQVLRQVFKEKPQAVMKYSSFAVPNVYFFDDFGPSNTNNDVPRYMHMLRFLYRSKHFTKPGFAVKSFISTNNTLAVFNHYALFPLFPHIVRTMLLNESEVRLHHYRSKCPSEMADDCLKNFMKYKRKDTLILKYQKELLTKVDRVLRELSLT